MSDQISGASGRAFPVTKSIVPNTSGTVSFSPVLSKEIIAAQNRARSAGRPVPFNKMSARQRLVDLAKKDRFSLMSSIVGFFASVYMIFRSIYETGIFNFSALADTGTAKTPQFITGSGRDAFDWYVGALMGVVLLISVLATYWADNEKKIDFGKDTTKTILGFVVGFLSGGKVA